MQLDKLVEENTALRNRLRDVAHSPLSDNEKQQLLFESQRHHSSAPASIASNVSFDAVTSQIPDILYNLFVQLFPLHYKFPLMYCNHAYKKGIVLPLLYPTTVIYLFCVRRF